jgi:excisionase family DNA binding protein
METNNDLLTVDEAADFLRLSTITIYKFKAQKKLPFTKLGGKLFFRKSKLIEYIRARLISFWGEIS